MTCLVPSKLSISRTGSKAALFATVTFTMTSPAAGSEQDAFAEATKRGAEAVARGDAEACRAAYAEALPLAPDKLSEAMTAAELGLCEEAADKPVLAYDHLLFALESEPPPSKGGGHGVWRRVRDALERLEHKVARTIVVASPGDAEIFLDGVSIGRNRSGQYITIAPGAHTWSARRDGFEEATFTHTVRAGDLPDVALYLPANRPREPSTASSAETVPPAKATEQKKETGGLSVGPKHANRNESPTLRVVLGGLVSVGLTSDAGPGLWVGGEVKWRSSSQLGFSLDLDVQGLLPRAALTLSEGRTLDIAQVVAAVVPCATYKWLSGCASIDAGVLIGSSPGPITIDGGGALLTCGVGPRLGAHIALVQGFQVHAFAALRVSPGGAGIDFVKERVEWNNPLLSGLFGLGVSFGEPIHGAP